MKGFLIGFFMLFSAVASFVMKVQHDKIEMLKRSREETDKAIGTIAEMIQQGEYPNLACQKWQGIARKIQANCYCPPFLGD